MIRPFFLSLLAAGLLGFVGPASSQPPAADYETLLPGYTLPSAGEIVVDGEGNAYLIASPHEDGQHLDVLVVKLGPSGNELWHVLIEASEHDYPADLALDSGGNLWVTGWTDSPDFPMVNAMDDTLTGFRDVFLMNLDASNGSILYSTFIGGDYTDSGSGIAISDAGEIYLTGVAGSTDYPTTPDAYQPDPSFPRYFYHDAFITKLSPAGDEILYSTYFGGTEDDWGTRVALDGDANIIIAGKTNALDFPLANAVDANPNDLFVSKFSADGGTLLFSSYLGGSDVDGLDDMSVDAGGSVYLTGSTRSVDYPTTPGAFEEIFVGAIDGCEVPFGGDFNCEDFYVSKLSTTGDGLTWSTFIGGTTVDQPRSVAIDAAGNAYVAGYTSSNDFPLGNPDAGGAQIVVCRLSDDGAALDYTLSIESGSANGGNGITVAHDGSVYFTGLVGVPAGIYVSRRDGGSQVVGIDEGTPAEHSGLLLGRNRPNPFNPTTRIPYVIPTGAGASPVELSVFDVSGRLVKRLVDEPKGPGSHTVSWGGRDERGARVSSGVYFYRLRWGSESISRRMVMLK